MNDLNNTNDNSDIKLSTGDHVNISADELAIYNEILNDKNLPEEARKYMKNIFSSLQEVAILSGKLGFSEEDKPIEVVKRSVERHR